MARTSAPHSASSQFFINTVDNGFLDFTAEVAQGWGYAVFGRVVAGTEVVDAIEKVRTGNNVGTCRRAAGGGDDRARRSSRLTRRARAVMAAAARRAAAGHRSGTRPQAWQAIDFISDLHLSDALPRTFEAWAAYMRGTTADAVFILGDLFEFWPGSDAVQLDFERRCIEVLRAAARQRSVALMVGNRDFLLTPALAAGHRRACR